MLSVVHTAEWSPLYLLTLLLQQNKIKEFLMVWFGFRAQALLRQNKIKETL